MGGSYGTGDKGFVPPKNTQEGANWHHAQKQTKSSGGGATCFPGDMRVFTLHGLRRIDGIEPGDRVFSISPNGSIEARGVLRRKSHAPNKIAEIIDLDGKRVFRATLSHSVLTEHGWKTVSDLCAGDVVISYDDAGRKKTSELQSVRLQDTLEPVYNLIVERNYSFLVEGCAAHSFTYFRTARIVGHELIRFITQAQPFKRRRLGLSQSGV